MDDQYAPGIPARVTEYADSVKKKFEENATTSFVRPRTDPSNELPILPPGVSRDKFNDSIVELKTIVDGHLDLVTESLDDGWYLHRPLTHDAFPLDENDEFLNSAVCSPGNVEQVQAVVRWANKWGIPIYPVSMGRNLGESISY